MTGVFGVFFPGEVRAYFLDEKGRELERKQIAKANPAELLNVHADVAMPAKTVKVVLHLIDDAGVDRGVLSEVNTAYLPGATS
jgi:hypothetical protein